MVKFPLIPEALRFIYLLKVEPCPPGTTRVKDGNKDMCMHQEYPLQFFSFIFIKVQYFSGLPYSIADEHAYAMLILPIEVRKSTGNRIKFNIICFLVNTSATFF